MGRSSIRNDNDYKVGALGRSGGRDAEIVTNYSILAFKERRK